MNHLHVKWADADRHLYNTGIICVRICKQRITSADTRVDTVGPDPPPPLKFKKYNVNSR